MFCFLANFQHICSKKQHFSYKGNKKAANRKGLAAQDSSVSYFFYGLCFLYILISSDLYFLQYGFQSSDEVIDILLGQYQWRKDTEDVGACATGEAVLLVDELAANFLVRNIEYGAYHQTCLLYTSPSPRD